MLKEFLVRHKEAILDSWLTLILETYPPNVSQLLKKEKDQFLNPVGSTLRHNVQIIMDGLAEEKPARDVSGALEALIRLRAVQDFTPAEATAVVFLLKQAIRGQLQAAKQDLGRCLEELWALESRIDAYAGRAFDLYMACREKIFEIRVHEIKNRTFKLLERANRLAGTPEEEES
jgi:hypothetical protein